MRVVKRALRVLGLAAVVLAVVLSTYIGYLCTSSAQPMAESSGWTRLGDLPRPRAEMAATLVTAVIGGPELCASSPCPAALVYIAGGVKGFRQRTVSDVDVFNPADGRWSPGPALPEPRSDLAMASLGGSAYVSGGTAGGSKPEADLWVLRASRGVWERLVRMPEARMGHAMVAVGDKLYVVGGRGESSRVLVFDPQKGWSLGAAMPEARQDVAAVVVGSSIVVIGGRDSGLRSRVDIYDTQKGVWTRGYDLPKADADMAAALLSDGRIHVVGGEDPGFLGGVKDFHFVFDFATAKWTRTWVPLQAVHGAAFVEMGGALYVLGGSRRQGALSRFGSTGIVQGFDPDTAL